MKNNIGKTARILRIALSVILIAFSISVNLSNFIRIILIMISIFLIFTSIIGFCPIYRIFNFNSKKIDPLERRK